MRRRCSQKMMVPPTTRTPKCKRNSSFYNIAQEPRRRKPHLKHEPPHLPPRSNCCCPVLIVCSSMLQCAPRCAAPATNVPPTPSRVVDKFAMLHIIKNSWGGAGKCMLERLPCVTSATMQGEPAGGH
jgi:hypothetical protein